MATARTYRPSDRIGQMRDKITIYTSVVTRTSTGGQRTQWVEWRTPFSIVENLRGHEAFEADRAVSVNSKRFTCRAESTPDINETMLIGLDGQYYDIKRIDYREDLPHRMYREIIAERRDTTITPVDFPTVDGNTAIFTAFAQRFTNVTANYVTVTAGTLISTTDHTEARINQLLFVFRGGLRLTYGSTADDGFTIDNATNRITPNFSLAGENVLVHQYQAT